MEAYNYQFTALRGIQSGREYYIAMCPLRLIPKIFLFDEEEIPPELRAQRVLNRARVPQIAQYIIDYPDDYVFSSLTASIDGDVNFESLAEHGYGRNAGVLTVSMNSRFLINDGQHRRAAIEEALKQNPKLGEETISVVFFVDAGLERSQQLFADLNKHAIRPTKSIGILYDRRDPFSQLSLKLMDSVPIFRGLTETEKTTISNRSSKVFTLSAIYQATMALLHMKHSDIVTESDLQISREYWTLLGETIPEWRLVITKHISPAELRQNYVHGHGVTLHAFGIAGHTLIETSPRDWQKCLTPLGTVDWLRTNRIWEGRAMIRGKMSKAGDSVALTAALIKKVLELPLTYEETELENTVLALQGE